MIYRILCTKCAKWYEGTSKAKIFAWRELHKIECLCTNEEFSDEELEESGNAAITYRHQLRQRMEPVVPKEPEEFGLFLSVLTELCAEKMMEDTYDQIYWMEMTELLTAIDARSEQLEDA